MKFYVSLIPKILLALWYKITNRNNAMATNRLVECSFCELRKGWFIKRCSECGCVLTLKARIPDEPCPHPDGSRWEQFEEDEA